MSVTSTQAISLLENVLFESATLAKANAAGWVTLSNLNSAYSTVSGLAGAMAGTAESSIAQQVVRYYEGALGRAPGGTEIAYYVNIAETGLTPAQIAQGATAVSQATWNIIASDFANSPEFSFASASASSVTTLLYLNILGRSPSATEVAYYNAQLASGLGNSTLVQEFVNSPEYTAKVSASIASNLGAYGTAVTGGTTPTTIGPVSSGASGSNTVLAFDSATNTYVAGVTISGTAGSTSNSLTLNDGAAAAGNYTLSLPSGATVSNIQTVNINGSGTNGITFDASSSAWSSVTKLNITSGGFQTLTVGSGATVVSTDTLAAGATPTATTIDGGSAVTLTATGTNSATALILGDITIGGTTAPAGAVSVTATETVVSSAGGAAGNITVNGGAGVTVNSTVNDGLALAITTGTTTAGDAGTITVAPTSGAVVVNDALNITSAATIATFADAVKVTGGSTITVNETVSATSSATGVSTITEGAVTVTGDSTTTSVTVSQAAVATGHLKSSASTGKAYVAAVTAATAAPGVDAVTAVTGVAYSKGSSAKASTPTVTADGAVAITDANYNTTTANTITSVSLTNYGAATIHDNALATLSLSGNGGGVTIVNATNGAGGVPTTTTGTLTLNLNSASETTGITDTNNDIKTLNIVTAGSSSTLNTVTDTSLKTVAISGTTGLTLTTVPASVTAITVAGSAGLTATVVDTTTSFKSTSTGHSVITVAGDATQAITGNGSDEIILSGTSATYNATSGKLFNTNVTGFSTLGIGHTGQTWDLSTFNSTFTKLDVEVAAATFTNVTTGTSLVIGAAGSTSYTSTDTNGANDSLAVTINGGAAGIAVSGLTVQDFNGSGYGTINVTSTVSSTTTGVANTLAGGAFDSAVTSLTVGGNAGLDITGTWAEANITSLTITNNVTDPAAEASGTVVVNALTADNLGNLVFSGTGTQGGTYATTITTLADTVGALTITNSGSAPAQITTLDETGSTNTTNHITLASGSTSKVDIGTLKLVAGITSLTLTNSSSAAVLEVDAFSTTTGLATLNVNGNVAIGADTTTAATAVGVTTGFTLSGSTDNAHVNFTLGAGTGTDTIKLGNGNDLITDGNTTGTVNVTLGTGYSIVDLHTGAAGAGNTVTFGAHTSTSTLFDEVKVGTTSAAASSPNYVLTGLVANDAIGIADATSVVALTTTQLSTAAAFGTLGAAVNYVDGLLGTAHEAAAFVWGTNTYVLESKAVGAGATTVNDTYIELVGTHTLTTGAVTGVITLAS